MDDYVSDYAFRTPPALRAAHFEPRDIGIVNFGRSFLSSYSQDKVPTLHSDV